MKFDNLLINNENFEKCKINHNYFFKKGIFFSYWNNKKFLIPNQGWKIHISSTYKNYEKVLKKVSNYCFDKNLSFKYVNSEKKLKSMFNKNFDRLQSGKLITIYSLNENNFKKTIIDLSKILKNYNSSPIIITDKRYKNSCIFYRYGSYKSKYIFFDNKKILDERKPFFNIPTFVKDPFEVKQDNTKLEKEIILNNRYTIKKALIFSNFGGVYLGYDNLLKKQCVVKEYRPFYFFNEKWTSISLGENESKILQVFNCSKITPHFIDSFFYDNHFFVVREYIEGIDLENLSYFYSLFFLTPNQREKVNESIIFFITFLTSILKLFLFSIKNKKIILDIKLNNFIYNKKTNKFFFIDLENVHDIETFFKDNPYYINNSWLSINNKYKSYFSVQKKISMLMINLISKSNSYLYFNKSAEKTFYKFKIICSYYKLPKFLVSTIIDLYANKNIDLNKTISDLEKFKTNNYEIYDLKNLFDEKSILKTAKTDFNDLEKYIKINLEKYKENSIDFLIANKILFNRNFELNITAKMFNKINWFVLFWLSENNQKKLLEILKNNYLLKNKTIEDKYKNLTIKILSVKFLKSNNFIKKEILNDFEQILKNFSIKNNSYYFIKNEKDKKVFYSPYLINGTAGLIFLLLEFYEITENKQKVKLFIDEYIDSITNFNLMKISFYNGIAGFLFVLIKYSILFQTNKFEKIIDYMIYSLHISKNIKNNSICYTDMYYMLKNNFSDKLGILYVIKQYLTFKSKNKIKKLR